jgi:hypothetical protein
MIHFHLIIRGRNCVKTIGKTLDSLLRQESVRWTAHVCLDDPRDGSDDVAFRWASARDPGCRVHHATVLGEHRGVAGTMYRAVEYLLTYDHPGDAGVVVILDGDGDTLPKGALSRVAHVYEKHPDTLVTYGSYKKKSKGDRTRISQAYPKGADVRTFPWHASHLKTFRASLLEHVKTEWFQDEKGKWLQAASDVALMLPLMELAGLDRCRHIHEITYVWNDSPVSKEKRALQRRCEAIVRAKPQERRLPRLMCGIS